MPERRPLEEGDSELHRQLRQAEQRIAQLEEALHAQQSGPRNTDAGLGRTIGPRDPTDPGFRAIFDAALDGMLLCDDEGVYVDVNPAASAMLGYPPAEMIGRHPWDFAAASRDTRAAWGAFLAAGVARGEFPLRRRDGAVRVLEFTARANVLPGRHLAIVRDVTAQRETQEALRLSEELFAKAFRASPVPLGISTAAEGRFVDINPSCAALIGRPREQVVGRTSRELGLWVDAGHTERLFTAMGSSGATRDFPTRLRRSSGEVRDVLLSTETIDVRGERCVLGVVYDVTDRNRARAELVQSLYFFERAQAVAHVGSWVWELASTDTLTWSSEVFRLFGVLPTAPLPSRTFFDHVHPDDRAAVERYVADVVARGTTCEFEHRIVRPDGTVRWIRWNGVVERDAAGAVQRLTGVVKDITDRQLAQEAVRASERRYRRIVETAAEGIWTCDPAGRVTFANARIAAMLGYRVDELVGRDVAAHLLPEHLPQLAENLQRRREGRTDSYVTALRRRDGTPLTVEVNATPLIDDAGRFEGSLAMLTDVTERARAEQERARLLAELARELEQRRSAETALRDTEAQLRQYQKLEAIGGLAAGIAHDFNNILSVIISYAALARDALHAGEPLREDLGEILAAAERAADLTRQLLAFSRRQVLAPRVVNLDAVIAGMERMVRRVVGEHIEVAIVPSPALGTVLVDPGQFEQVILNVVVNARDAMPTGGKLTIETANVDFDEATARAQLGPAPGPGAYVMVAVADTGVGMDAETRQRMFDPFFTTKDKGKGTGLGLATVFGIVKQSGGHIWVSSEPGRGTSIKVYLPRSDRAAQAPDVERSPSASLRGTETILVVDDEEGIRAIMRSSLQRQGYTVLTAANAGEALLICERHPGSIDLLVTDVVMPIMSGRALAERLTLLRPAMRVLFVSGYTDDAIVHHGVLEAGLAFMQKPIRPDALARRVREVLEGPPPAPRGPR